MAGWIKQDYVYEEDAVLLVCPHCGYSILKGGQTMKDIPVLGEKPVYSCGGCKQQNHLPSLRKL